MNRVPIALPVAEPVTLIALKSHGRITVTADDALLKGFLNAAVREVEDYSGWRLHEQTWELQIDAFPSGADIELPFPPLQSVASVKYIDTDGNEQTLDTSVYDVDTKGEQEPGFVRLAFNQTWPSIRSTPNAVKIRFVCGFTALVTTNAGTDIFTATNGKTHTDQDRIRLWVGQGGALPTVVPPLAEKTDYFVRDVTGATFKIETGIGGTALDVTAVEKGKVYAGLIPLEFETAIKQIGAHLYDDRDPAGSPPSEALPLNLFNRRAMTMKF